jgi:Flp pilus assembly protein TadG
MTSQAVSPSDATPSRCARRADNDRGAVVVIFALILLTLLIVTALVVDLGMARETRRRAQSDADFAALAAGWYLAGNGSSGTISDPQAACKAAVNSIATNVSDWPAAATANMNGQCNGFPSDAAVCSSSTIYSAVSTNGSPYVLAIQWPVPDSEISRAAWNGSVGSPAPGLGSEDGNLCERMSVSLQRDDPALFASVLGRDGESVTASAVGRGSVDSGNFGVPSLLLLQRNGCGSLQTSGQGAIRLQSINSQPGTAHTDTSALTSGTNACSNNNNATGWGIYATSRPASDGQGPSIIVDGVGTVPGRIQSYAANPSNLAAGGRPGYYFDPGCDWGTGVPAPPSCLNSGLSVAPTAGRIVSRRPVDDKYGVSIASLHNTWRPVATAGSAPAGYAVLNDCNNVANVVYQDAAHGGSDNLYVNCDSFEATGPVVFRGQNIVFKGKFSSSAGYIAFPNADKIIVRGCASNGGCSGGNNFAISNSAFLSVNTGESIPSVFNYIGQLNAGAPPATWKKVDCLAQRAGPGAGGTYNHATVLATFGSKIVVQNGTMDLCQTTVYAGSNQAVNQTTGSPAGTMSTYSPLQITSGGNCSVNLPCPLWPNHPDGFPGLLEINSGPAPAVSWSAPNLSTGDITVASPLEDLAYWTEGVGSCTIAGQGALKGSGVFFYPNCALNYGGQADNNNPLNAQFIGYSLNMSGQGILRMRPNPLDSVQIPLAGTTTLIR